MPKPRSENGVKNLISKRMIQLRNEHHMSQRELAHKLQLAELEGRSVVREF